MAATKIATLQTIWDCKWSRINCSVSGESRLGTPLWTCIRPGRKHRGVTEEECETCANWEANDATPE
jgi:hypothetical protein